MCRLDRISAHLETFHHLTWICCDQNSCLPVSCGVGELSAASPRGAVPCWGCSMGAGARFWWWRGEAFITAGSVSGLLVCSLSVVRVGHARREQFPPRCLNFPLVLCKNKIYPWVPARQQLGVCQGDPWGPWGEQDLSLAGSPAWLGRCPCTDGPAELCAPSNTGRFGLSWWHL